MDTLYHFFTSGLWDRYTIDHITLFFAVLIVAYTLSSYKRVGALCSIFAFFALIGIIAVHLGLHLSNRATFILSSLTVLIPAFFCIFGVTAKPSTATEKMGLFISAIAGTLYGMTSLGQMGGNDWIISSVAYSLGLWISVCLLSLVILVISRLLEYITLAHRDIAIITSSIAIGVLLDTVISFVKDILR
ncbi:MAG: hypothetical protein PHD21_06935 [Flavobacteriales bacterium]|nr:hypothetical protein [Flavobacteriales bacterium]